MQYSEAQLCKLYASKNTSLSNVRANMLPIWTDIRNFIAPRTARFPGEQVNSGTRQDLNIINGSIRDAVRTLAAGMQSGVTSPMRPWFRLGTPDPQLQEYAPVKMWLFMVERLMRDVLTRSNIYDRLKSNYATLGTYGTSAIIIDEDVKDIARGRDLPIGSFSIATDEAGRVNTLYRDTSMNPEAMIGKFGKGNDPTEKYKSAQKLLPRQVMNAYDNGNYDFMYPLVHIIEPNRNFVMGSALSKLKMWSSVWFDPAKGSESILLFSGYDDQPFMVPRWDVLGEDDWGFGCGEMALGDSKQKQLMEKRKLQGIDKNAHPPTQADASLRNQKINNMPGETTYVSGLIAGRPGIQRLYEVNPYINELREEIQSVTNREDTFFYKNLFLMVSEIADQPNITATQINTMREEKLLMLGPVLERLNDELLDPMISRLFNIMYAAGMLPPPPPEIQGMPLRVEYISVLAQAQKAMGIGNIERFVGFVGNLAQQQAAAGLQPTAWDKVNIDQTIDEYADGVAIPPTIIYPDEEVQAKREADAQKAQMAQSLAAGQQMAETAKTVSETDLSGDNPLARALQTAGAA